MVSQLVPQAARATATLFALAALTACSTSTKLTDQWQDPTHKSGPLTKLVVIAVDVEPATRRHIEDRFHREFGEEGVQAAASYAVLGEQLPDRETARAALSAGGYDGALVLRLHRVDEETRYVPGDYFYGGPYWAPTYSPGRYVTDKIVMFETSLWDLRDGKRVWMANTRTENPSSSKDFAKSVSKEVIPELVEKGLVAKVRG